VIEELQKSVGSLDGLASQLSLVNAAIAANKPDSVKLVVAREEFEENIQPLLDEFPKKTKELRAAVRTFFDLAQARNEKILAYNALFVQKAEVRTRREQITAEIQAIQTMIREKKQVLAHRCCPCELSQRCPFTQLGRDMN
jgi:SMC interacting uncharacterized protein involved in chromosome segregation